MITFKTFGTFDEAEEIRSLLAENLLSVEIQDTSLRSNPALRSTPYSDEFRLQLSETDFDKANQLIKDYMSKDLESVNDDYYLFAFTNSELEEIIIKSDEWSLFDVLLAEKILKEKGVYLTKDKIERRSEAYRKKIAAPEKRQWLMIILGYVFSLGFIGLLFGGLLVNSKKTLPSGEKVYSYSQLDRNHGFVILGIGILWLLYFLLHYILYIEFF